MIKLFFREFFTKEIKEKLGYPLIRLMCYSSFERRTETIEKDVSRRYSIPMESIVDTGAHTTVLPFYLWQGLKIERIGTYEMYGLSSKPECAVPAVVGKLNCILLDRDGNHTRPVRIYAHMALTDDVPLILGFKNLLSRFKVCFDYGKKEAYLETKVKKMKK